MVWIIDRNEKKKQLFCVGSDETDDKTKNKEKAVNKLFRLNGVWIILMGLNLWTKLSNFAKLSVEVNLKFGASKFLK